MEATRETFGNIPHSSQLLFYFVGVAAMAVFVYGVWRRFCLWRHGLPVHARELFIGNFKTMMKKLKPGIRRLLVEGLGQQRVRGRGMAGRAHILMFAGFMMLFVGTLLLEIDHLAGIVSQSLQFHHGTYYIIYEFTLDFFGIFFLAGCLYFLCRRLQRPSSLGHRTTDFYVLICFILIGVTGYLVEALRILWQQPTGIGAKCSPVGLWLASFLTPMAEDWARKAHFGVWWFHALLAFGFMASIPYTRLFHLIAGPLNLFFAPSNLGYMHPITMEEVERTERMGVSDVRHLTQQQLLSLDACMECGRCEEACPAFVTGKPLSPKKVVQDLKQLMEKTFGRKMEKPRLLHGETISSETLWACTACSACVNVCPVRVDQVTLILDMRRYLVGEGGLSGTAATALRRIQSSSNPWGLPAGERAAWIEPLNEPATGVDKPVLFT